MDPLDQKPIINRTPRLTKVYFSCFKGFCFSLQPAWQSLEQFRACGVRIRKREQRELHARPILRKRLQACFTQDNFTRNLQFW